EDFPFGFVDAVSLKPTLGDIQSDADDLAHDKEPLAMSVESTATARACTPRPGPSTSSAPPGRALPSVHAAEKGALFGENPGSRFRDH
ncbi:MAG TPA: hypothetical protein VMI06_08645, partial [Terriglobia bacterium]|nr:hypothetical protein [Terriglobia bacterium]